MITLKQEAIKKEIARCDFRHASAARSITGRTSSRFPWDRRAKREYKRLLKSLQDLKAAVAQVVVDGQETHASTTTPYLEDQS